VRIGGDLEIDVSIFSRSNTDNFSPLPNLYKIWVDTGRSALLIALREIVRQGGAKNALLPAYICPSVILPFVKLGFQLRFYTSNGLANTLPPISGETILFAHYFGKKNSTAIKWIEKLQENCNIFVIEDCVQASLNSNVGETGDFVITSYRKFLEQPDGAILGTRKKIYCGHLNEPDEEFVSAKLVGKILRQHSIKEELFLKPLRDAEGRLDRFLPRKMSWLSKFMMQRTDIKKIVLLRRTNWLNLYEALNEEKLFDFLSPLFRNIDIGDVPLGFPVYVNDDHRDKLRHYLAEQHIYCPIHWSLDHLENIDHKYHAELALSRNVLTLPIDQRLNERHIKYMALNIVNYIKHHT